MNCYLHTHPQVLSFLQDAHENPEGDAPRLILADFLEDHGDPDRAEFIRLQCRLGAGAPALEKSVREQLAQRCGNLLERRGGGWLGPLWNWSISPMDWHRGLLALRVPRKCNLESLVEILPWLDTGLFVLHGKKGFQRVASLLRRSSVNHIHLDFRTQMHEDAVLKMLATFPECPCLRSMSFHWPLALLRRHLGDGVAFSVAAVSDEFLTSLLGKFPLARRLTHLGTSRPFVEEQVALIRAFGVEAVHIHNHLWMHRQPPAVFKARSACAAP